MSPIIPEPNNQTAAGTGTAAGTSTCGADPMPPGSTSTLTTSKPGESPKLSKPTILIACTGSENPIVAKSNLLLHHLLLYQGA